MTHALGRDDLTAEKVLVGGHEGESEGSGGGCQKSVGRIAMRQVDKAGGDGDGVS